MRTAESPDQALPITGTTTSLPTTTPAKAEGINSPANLFKQSLGGLPARRQLADSMSIAYSDGRAKRQLRNEVKQLFLKYIDMSKPFTAYEYNTEIYPVVKACTAYMNREVLPPGQKWVKATTQHVIQTIFEDTRRNAGSRIVQAEKRDKKRKV